MACRRLGSRLPVVVMAAVAVMRTTAVAASSAAGEGSAEATVRSTEYGIPHITASGWEALGPGYGYFTAKDTLGALAGTYPMVGARRSRHLGPDGRVSPGRGRNTIINLNGDRYFQRINDDRVVERLIDQPASNGPEPEVKEMSSSGPVSSRRCGSPRTAPPQSSSLLTYSRSIDPATPHYADRTRLFSAGRWVTERFTGEQIAASPELEVEVLS
ncbi:hypothetical protein GCM10010300_82430 [Streptomyces olivaceoviridis]|uniref:penicillin acylase family protein n=1 Tax=Streptomyces olivaceoviridis TaxID=1921 RepID=UPI0016737F6C|nr:penicillin acylase family protein [Streptomyces olivaceoviridis]GGZ26622.1 hypothetical protein GCM10010300_82430 [Streptomyces olivaceoviridis]